MKFLQNIGKATSLALVLCLVAVSGVSAQRQQVRDLNRQAMEHYNNLEIDAAQAKLDEAMQICQRRNVTGEPLARTNLNLGVIAVGGMGDNAAGMQYFQAALEADSSIQLDPLTSTPEITTVFNLARSRMGEGGGNQSSGGGGANGNIPHQPVPEQLAQTAVPVFVEVPGDAPVDSIYLYYKGLGMRDFRRVEMQRMSDGYGFEIPCGDVYEPKVEYYLVAFGSDGSPLGFSGTAETPIEVPIVSSRSTSPPALPGTAPPEQCSDSECPPNMPGCQSGGGGGGGMGDTCLSDSECRSGLSCQDNFCVADDDGGGGGDGDGGDFWGWYEDAPTLFFQIGVGLGASYVSGGMYADGEPMGNPGDDDVYIPEGEGDCVDNGDDFQDYCVRVETPGFVPGFALRLMLGGFVQPWLGLAASMRIAPNAGTGTMAGMLIGGRVILRPFGDLLPYADLRLHVGTTFGQVQAQPPQSGAPEPFIRSGLNGVNFGVSNVFNFMKYVGAYVEVDAQILFPVSIFNLDLHAGLQVGF